MKSGGAINYSKVVKSIQSEQETIVDFILMEMYEGWNKKLAFTGIFLGIILVDCVTEDTVP